MTTTRIVKDSRYIHNFDECSIYEGNERTLSIVHVNHEWCVTQRTSRLGKVKDIWRR